MQKYIKNISKIMKDVPISTQELLKIINEAHLELLSDIYNINGTIQDFEKFNSKIMSFGQEVKLLGILCAAENETNPYHNVVCHGRFPSLYKYISIPNALDDVQNNHLRCSSPSGLNDPFECQLPIGTIPINNPNYEIVRKLSNELVKVILNKRNSVHVASFTESMTVPMWAYYGSNGKGAVIELDLNTLQRDDSDPVLVGKVNYSDDRKPLLSVSNWKDVSYIILGLRMFDKHSSWKHEREWRLVSRHEFLKIDGCIRKVILGYDVNPDDETAQTLIAECVKREIPVMQTIMEDFQMKTIPIEK